MKKLMLVPLIPAAAACAALAGPALASTTASGKTEPEAVSENWAGYETTPASGGSDFKVISAQWTQPKVDCSATSGESDYSSYGGDGDGYGIGGGSGLGGYGSSDSGSYSAFWVGLGGGDTNAKALEQDGTQSDCTAAGKAQYYAWYEMVPSAPVKVPISVKPGDKIWAQTAVSGDQVSFSIENKTTGQTWSNVYTMKTTPDTKTAEVIAEAPSECSGDATSDCSPLTLADFGKVNFSDISITNDASTTGGVSSSSWNAQPISLEGEASPGSVSSSGTAFNVTYGDSSSSGSSYGQTGSSGYGSSGDGGYSGDGYGDSGYGDSGDPYGYSGGYGDSGYGDYGDGYGYSDGYGDGGYSYYPSTYYVYTW
jgi:hypothetical protein